VNSNNAKTESPDRKVAIRIVAERDDVRVIRSRLVGPDELAISEDDERGGDPYNSTGQHVVIKMKSISQD